MIDPNQNFPLGKRLLYRGGKGKRLCKAEVRFLAWSGAGSPSGDTTGATVRVVQILKQGVESMVVAEDIIFAGLEELDLPPE